MFDRPRSADSLLFLLAVVAKPSGGVASVLESASHADAGERIEDRSNGARALTLEGTRNVLSCEWRLRWRLKASPGEIKIVEEFRSWAKATHVEVVARAGRSNVEKVTLSIVDRFKISEVAHFGKTVRRGDHVLIERHYGHGSELKPFCIVHGHNLHSRRLGCRRLGSIRLLGIADEDTNLDGIDPELGHS